MSYFISKMNFQNFLRNGSKKLNKKENRGKLMKVWVDSNLQYTLSLLPTLNCIKIEVDNSGFPLNWARVLFVDFTLASHIVNYMLIYATKWWTRNKLHLHRCEKRGIYFLSPFLRNFFKFIYKYKMKRCIWCLKFVTTLSLLLLLFFFLYLKNGLAHIWGIFVQVEYLD